MSFKDHFSKQAADYARFRPGYPRELFDYLVSIAPSRRLAWDCGTGNGQAAAGLASVFDAVIATDASEKQITNAELHERVDYLVAPAEDSSIDFGTVDLIMVRRRCTGSIWTAFTRRVLKSDGVLAASAYNLLHINPAIDEVVNRYYYEVVEVVGPFWPQERKLVEQFDNLPFPFHEIDPPKFEMTAQWNLDHLVGYLRTWSSTQRFMAAKGSDPLKQIMGELRAAWGTPEQTRNVIWPLTLRIGRKTKNRGPVRRLQSQTVARKRLNRTDRKRSNRSL